MDEQMHCELVSWDQFYSLVRKLAFTIRAAGYRPDVVVAIGRGGYVPARVLCDYFDVMDLASIKLEHYHATERQASVQVKYPLAADLTDRRVLVVDDVSDTGETFEAAIEHVYGHSRPADVRTAALHHKQVSRFVPDYYAEKVTRWRWIIYPWAVVEDVSALVNKLNLAQQNPELVAEQLERAYGIRLSREMLGDVLALMQTAKDFAGD
jgi:hypoxanthine phosphoribosyltransferase